MGRSGCQWIARLNRNSPVTCRVSRPRSRWTVTNAGADTPAHPCARSPRNRAISKNFNQYNDQIGRLRNAVPKMILQLGGSISFAPEPGEEAHFQSYDSRHKLAEINPKPDQVTAQPAEASSMT